MMNSRTVAVAPRFAGYPPGGARSLAAVCGLVLCLATAASAQYTGPVSPQPTVPVTPGAGSIPLVGIGGAAPISATGFRLTFSAPYQAGAVWMVNKPSIA